MYFRWDLLVTLACACFVCGCVFAGKIYAICGVIDMCVMPYTIFVAHILHNPVNQFAHSKRLFLGSINNEFDRNDLCKQIWPSYIMLIKPIHFRHNNHEFYIKHNYRFSVLK